MPAVWVSSCLSVTGFQASWIAASGKRSPIVSENFIWPDSTNRAHHRGRDRFGDRAEVPAIPDLSRTPLPFLRSPSTADSTTLPSTITMAARPTRFFSLRRPGIKSVNGAFGSRMGAAFLRAGCCPPRSRARAAP